MSIVVNGSGTITGISTGGLPDGSVDVDTLAANSVTAAKIVDGTIVDAEVTSLNASKLTGTVADARISTLTASKLTGALPALDGSSLTGVGVDGISSSADATAITIDSSEKVNFNQGRLQLGHINKFIDTANYVGDMINIAYHPYSAGINLGKSYPADSPTTVVKGIEISNTALKFYTPGSGSTPAQQLEVKDGTFFWNMTSKTQAISTGAASYFSDSGSENSYASLFIGHNSAQKHGIVLRDWNSSGGPQVDFKNSSDSRVGKISASASSTTYSTSSDYRLKENVVPMTGSIDRLKELKPSKFNFIVDADTTVDGFLAHEAQTVVPEAISGTKDAMTTEVLYTEDDELPEGKNIGDVKEPSVIDPQGIDQSKLVPLLTSALQEAVAKIEELTTRIEILEAN